MENIEELSLNHLKSELINLEILHQKLAQQLKSSKKKQDRLQSHLQTTRQQIDFYTQECQKSLECLKDSNWKLTKDMCKNLRKLERPSPFIKDICEKLMLILNQPDCSFESFKQLSKNFGQLKDLMTSIQALPVSETVINEILPIWKNQAIIQAKLGKTCKCASLLAEWIGFIVEFSLKKATVLSSKRKEPEIEKKLKNQTAGVEEAKNEFQKIIEKITAAKKLFDCRVEMDKEELSDQFGSHEGGTEFYRTGLHRPTASDISGAGTGKVVLAEFPNFVGDDLYADLGVMESQEKIAFEGISESIGCCRLKFFCF